MGDSILKKLSQLSQNGHFKGFVYNIIIWLHFLLSFKSNMAEYLCSYYRLQICFEQLYFRLFKSTNLDEDVYHF